MIKPFDMRLLAVLMLTVAALSCARLDEAKNAAINKAVEHAVKAAAGGGDQEGAERRLTVSGKSPAPNAKELYGAGLIPPGAELQSYIKGIAEDTANITSTLSLADLELFYDNGLKKKGYRNESEIKADGMLSVKWLSADDKKQVSVYAFETKAGTKGSVVFTNDSQ